MIKYTKIFFLFLFSTPFLLVFAEDNQLYKLNITQLFDLADENSRSIKISDLAEKEASQAARVAKKDRLPAVDVSLSASYLGDGWMADRNFTHGENAPMPHFGNNFSIEASQVVYAGGAISSKIEIAELSREIASMDKEKNRQDIRFLLVRNYLELYKLSNQSEIYKKNIEQTNRLLSDIKAKEKEGIMLKNDITRHELRLKSLELALIQAENNRTVINHQLVITLGLPPDAVIEVDTCVLGQIPLVTAEASWQTAAQEVSPLLKQARLLTERSSKNEKLVKAERLPSIALFAGNHLDGPITIEVPPINKNFNYWYAGIGVKFNIASIYKSGENVRLARYSSRKSVEMKKMFEDNIRTDVKSDYVRFVESFTICDTRMKSLELANQNYAVIKNRYLNDLALITDMLDASNSKLDAELQVSNARISILLSYYKLKKTTGNL